jgi:hypothetical protein
MLRPHHELAAEHAHGVTQRLAHHRLTGARDQPSHITGQIPGCFVVQPQQPPGQHQSPRGGVDEQRRGAGQVLVPAALAQLLLDQPVGGRGVGDAQQGLGEAHEHHPFLRGQVVLAQEGVDASGADALGPHRLHQRLRPLAHPRAGLRVEPRVRDEILHAARLVGQPQGVDARARGVEHRQGPAGNEPARAVPGSDTWTVGRHELEG